MGQDDDSGTSFPTEWRFGLGDLVQIKEGCGDSGKIGAVIRSPSVEGWLFIDLLLDGSVRPFNGYWIEPVRQDPIGV